MSSGSQYDIHRKVGDGEVIKTGNDPGAAHSRTVISLLAVHQPPKGVLERYLLTYRFPLFDFMLLAVPTMLLFWVDRVCLSYLISLNMALLTSSPVSLLIKDPSKLRTVLVAVGSRPIFPVAAL
jgi:hypothetical protein